MSKQILVNFSHYETRVATLENGEIRSLHIEREEDKNVVGNIYLGVVKRVLPGMQAAFLELGLERTAFLYVDDIIDQPFGGDFDLLEEDSSVEGESTELGAEDDGEPLKESYDEEVESEEGRQKWERDVTEISAKGAVTVNPASTEPVVAPTEETEEFFEKSPEERAEELVETAQEDENSDEDELLFESEDTAEDEEESDESDEDIESDEDFEEDEETEFEDELENKEEAPPEAKAVTEQVLETKSEPVPFEAKESQVEAKTSEILAEGSETQPKESRQPDYRNENENDNLGNRINSSRGNSEEGRPRGRSWGRGGQRHS